MRALSGLPVVFAAAPEHGALTVFFAVTAVLYLASILVAYLAVTRAFKGRHAEVFTAALSLLALTLLATAFFSALPVGTVERVDESGAKTTVHVYRENPYLGLLMLPVGASVFALFMAAVALIVYFTRGIARRVVVYD